MIYLVCAQDSKKRIVELKDKDYVHNDFFRFYEESTYHKNILYPLEFYNLSKQIFPNRVNVVFSKEHKRNLIKIPNGIVMSNTKEIVNTYHNKIDDLFILASHEWIINEFQKFADFLIIYTSDTIGFTHQQIVEDINFADFNLIKTINKKNCTIYYFARTAENFLGY